jgi:hypothetical protein
MIPLPFAALRRARGDDADDFVATVFVDSFCVGYKKQSAFDRANAIPPFLAVVLALVRLI